ncbi:MAG: hypothetical protein HYY84_02330 [Deltaproteobacteria bacterium]|nr:hypothetical protein [Deltaproteobacteria bacterium]
MESDLPLLLVALGAGLVHGVAADHALAMAAAMPSGARLRGAIAVGLKFGVGHSAMIIAVGLVPLLLGLTVPPGVWNGIERALGGLLIVLGAAALTHALSVAPTLHAHDHTHEGVRHRHWHLHFFSRSHGRFHRHPHGAWLLGAIFGLGGVGAVVPHLASRATIDAATSGLLFALAFGVGVTASMTLLALTVRGAGALAARRPVIERGFQLCVALGSVGVGLSMLFVER